jgi:hypothetical protein
MNPAPDWAAWSREAVQLMTARNAAFVDELGLANRPYEWNMDAAKLVFPSPSDPVEADLCVLGSISVSEGTFLWAWANTAIPAAAKNGLDRVRKFGEANALGLLTDSEWRGGRAEGLEVAAIAGRLLDAAGIWIAPMGDVTLFFALSNIRAVPPASSFATTP